MFFYRDKQITLFVYTDIVRLYGELGIIHINSQIISTSEETDPKCAEK